HQGGDRWAVGRPTPDQIAIAGLLEGVEQIRRLKPNARTFLFVDDGFPPESWNPTYIVRLAYRDQDIVVERRKNPTTINPNLTADVVLNYCQGAYATSCPASAN